MLFGRAQEEIEALAAAGVACEVVPGVTSALAATAEMGVSLTRRGMSRSVTFATPRVGEGEDTSDWAPSVASADTAVLYMAAGQAAQIARVLQAQGMSPATPVMIVENASLADARQIGTTLRGLRESTDLHIHGPALLFFGEVYRQRAHVLNAAAVPGDDETADEPLQRRALPR
jgi:uroporphyrin-III C-methyltransferase